ncbi:AAA family ATPase [Paenibacillus sp. MMS20-IR301]|uniref:AAA family ATPase n=1 Tax=Paenibacillus sp. MMS20-IR301 TaxID=2895946 RepID=UPI0028EB9B4B|nr:AAA family ATPase [Paenibacillus sp. MMS20-IR301]WNS42037.1 AAA family ATPase [Paenibacillus sp. MMS20-IR301]
MNEQMMSRAEVGILRKDYVSDKETQFYILTFKLTGNHYHVKVLEQTAVLASTDVNGRLDVSKMTGVRLLLQAHPNVNFADVTMVHYKDDRPNGKAWQKDSEKVLKQLFALQSKDAGKTIEYRYMRETLNNFNRYRQTQEENYQAVERRFKDEIVSAVGPVLRKLDTNPNVAIAELISILSGQGNYKFVRSNLLRLFAGSVWLEDFLVFLRNTTSQVSVDFLQELIDQGVTEAVRGRLAKEYNNLLNNSHFPPNKRKAETPVQLLAMLLASYSPEEYVFYRPNDFGPYADRLGFNAPNDVVERYALYNQIAHLVLEYARANADSVRDLMDAYHVVFFADQLIKDTGGVAPMAKNQSFNKILYGPPGTGKTYNVIYEALSLLDPTVDSDLLSNPTRRGEAVSLFSRYVDSNQIKFCTFHQSFSYEEFVEGIRFSQEKNSYEVQDGLFKQLCSAARAASAEQKKTTYDFDPEKTRFFKMSLGNTLAGEDDVYDYCIENNQIALGWGEKVDFSSCKNKQEIRKLYESQLPKENPYGVEFVERFKHWMQIGDIVIISHGNKKARAIGKITGDYTFTAETTIGYHQFRSVQWLYEDNEVHLPVDSILREKVFSQQTVYMFYNKDLNMESLKKLISGNQSNNSQDQQYVLVIDEINRGNISKIFGELITLIEPDKRMGQKNELSVTLPYSGDRLRVPSNVHILGTMNTADRSTALLDTALRRRFEFKEILPNYGILPTDVQGINVRKLLETINKRIEFLYDREHVIGHSYFIMEKPSTDAYIKVMFEKVIPLLQEYFYDDWERIELVLGGAGKLGDRSYFLNIEELRASVLFAKRAGGLMEPRKSRYIVQSNPTEAALKRIYEQTADPVEQDDEE